MRRLTKTLRRLAILVPIGALASQGEVPLPNPPDNNFPTQPRPGRYVEHWDQWRSTNMVKQGHGFDAWEIAQEKGDDFFDNLFLADQIFGVGADVGQGQRFSRVPRADLQGPKNWASHVPARATGPNAASCIECHTMVRHDGSGFAGLNAIRDPLHSGSPSLFINRNTPHLFGQGALQLLAEEMTADLHRILDVAKAEECGCPTGDGSGRCGAPGVMGPGGGESGWLERRLRTKGTDFGYVRVKESGGGCEVDLSGIQGIDKDLVVKPFQWRGSVAFIRDFNRGAAHNENGQQAVELVGEDFDGDGDGVTNEVSVGDLTVLTVYIASQPRPTTKVELASIKQIPALSTGELASIKRGEKVFDRIGCASCHTPMMKLANPVYSEPSQSPYYRDKVFPAGQDPVALGLDPRFAIKVDLTKEVVGDFGTFLKDKDGRAKVELYSDLKRHYMGPECAESIDEAGTGHAMWLTKALWGVGSTPPYMHDGRATTISQAIEAHGGEGATSRADFRALPKKDQDDLVSFLMNMRIFKFIDIDS